ncbi:MAG: TlpA family protein disulfide reductase [Bacteroidia bacterium]|nr:TlpA family protein disulfide reductase [Bacteroidia bacterium]
MYNKPLIVLAIMFGFMALFSNCGTPKKGDMAPDFETILIDGSDFKLSDLQGNYVILDFWGSWCGPCRTETPKLVSLYSKYKGKKFSDADDIYVVSVALEKNDKSWKLVADKLGIDWKHQVVEKAKFVRFSNLAQKYNVTDIPSKFLISPKGELLPQNTIGGIDKYLSERIK